jgi:hypothetical protein
MHNSKWLIASLLGLLLLAPVMAADEQTYDDEAYTPPENDTGVTLKTGYQDSSTDGNLNLVSEYWVVDANPILGLGWYSAPYDKTQFNFNVESISSRQYKGDAGFDLSRKFQVDAKLIGFIHRLEHDPLANMQGVSDIKVVRATDYDPDTLYGLDYKDTDIHAEFQPPQAAGFTLRAGYRSQERKGTRQQLNSSHCTSCHVTGQGREIDNQIQQGDVGVHWGKGLVDLDYQVTNRQYKDNAAGVYGSYEAAQHPGTTLPVFDDRVWFQNTMVPIAVQPEINRTEHKLKARVDFKKGGVLNLMGLYADVKNQKQNLAYDFKGFNARYSLKLGDPLKLNLWGRYDELQNDSYDVDLLALNGLASAPTETYPGGVVTNYQDWRRGVDGNPDLNFTTYTRLSAMNRTTSRMGADLYWKPGRRSTGLASYEFRLIDRDYVILGDGTGQSTRHKLKLAWNQRAYRKLRWNNSLTFIQTDNPYVSVDGGRRAFAGYADPPANTTVLGTAPNPKVPASLQYDQLQALRIANLTAMPAQEMRFRSYLTWSPSAAWALNGNVRYRAAENNDLDYSEWSKDSFGVGVNLWVAAGPQFQFTMGIDHDESQTDAMMYIPLMDG